MARAEAAGADALAVFTAATDAFTEHNIGMTVERVARRPSRPSSSAPAELGWWRRGYVSTAFGCPYTGARRARPGRRGRAAAARARRRRGLLRRHDRRRRPGPGRGADRTGRRRPGIPLERIAFHFHDTRGTALANVAAGLDAGVRCFDCSTGGTGGCPYAPGAAGNLATEDLVYLLDASGCEHGVVARRRPRRRALHRRRARPAARDARSARPAAGTRRPGAADRSRLSRHRLSAARSDVLLSSARWTVSCSF